MKITFLLFALTIITAQVHAGCSKKMPGGKVTKIDCSMNRVALLMKR